MATFDVEDRDSWYFGAISREDANDVLRNERDGGVFLVRDSHTCAGDYVLCVRESSKFSHYIINKIQQDNQILYRIGDHSFPSLPDLLRFYTKHYLDTTSLKKPATKRFERVLCRFDFEGTDQDDLPFRRGEILTIINKDEDQWWTAKNSSGKIGQIPVPYVQKYEENGQNNTLERPGSGGSGGVAIRTGGGLSKPNQPSSALKKSNLSRKLPAFARVKQARVPNAYDKTALKLEVDDIIKVTKTNINGQWEGELKGKIGHFPFTHVEFIDGDNDVADGNDSNTTTTGNAGIGGVGGGVVGGSGGSSSGGVGGGGGGGSVGGVVGSGPHMNEWTD